MHTNAQHVIDVLAQHMNVLRETYHVKTIGIFGSIVRGEETAASDVDVMVEFSAPVGFFTFLDLEEYLARILGRRVDLVTKNGLKPAIRETVLRDTIYV